MYQWLIHLETLIHLSVPLWSIHRSFSLSVPSVFHLPSSFLFHNHSHCIANQFTLTHSLVSPFPFNPTLPSSLYVVPRSRYPFLPSFICCGLTRTYVFISSPASPQPSVTRHSLSVAPCMLFIPGEARECLLCGEANRGRGVGEDRRGEEGYRGSEGERNGRGGVVKEREEKRRERER